MPSGSGIVILGPTHNARSQISRLPDVEGDKPAKRKFKP